MNTLQINRQFFNGKRHKHCGFDCKQEVGSTVWHVHFWGDHIASEDFTSTDDELFTTIKTRHDLWIEEMKP
jgi:hypothetical protein